MLNQKENALECEMEQHRPISKWQLQTLLQLNIFKLSSVIEDVTVLIEVVTGAYFHQYFSNNSTSQKFNEICFREPEEELILILSL